MKRWIGALNRSRIFRSVWRIDGINVVAPTFDRALYCALHKWRLAGSEEEKLLRILAAPGDCVLDIGANIGLYTALLSRLVGATGRVHAFEPNPLMANALREMLVLNHMKNVVFYETALGRHGGEAKLALASFNSGDSRIHNEVGKTVSIARGDDLLGDIAVDLIKIDVQGYELPVLEGLTRTIDRSRGLKVLFEYWPSGMASCAESPAALVEFFVSKKFKLYLPDRRSSFRPISWTEINRHLVPRPWGSCGNFIAVGA